MLAFRRKELDCHATFLECGFRLWAAVLRTRMQCTPTLAQRSQMSVSPLFISPAASTATRSTSLVSAFLEDKPQCSTPSLLAYRCSVYFLAYRFRARKMGLPLRARPLLGASLA